jgi:hypothetical protein
LLQCIKNGRICLLKSSTSSKASEKSQLNHKINPMNINSASQHFQSFPVFHSLPSPGSHPLVRRFSWDLGDPEPRLRLVVLRVPGSGDR